MLLFKHSTKLNCLTNSAVQQLYRFQKHNACLLLPVTSLHYTQIKRKQTGFESRYNATITQQKKKDFPNSSTNEIMNVKFLTIFATVDRNCCLHEAVNVQKHLEDLQNLICNHCKRVNNKFKKSYDLPLDLLQYRRENSAEYLYS